MWELDYKESWALRIDALELWCWRRLLRVPWIARRYNQAILKEISPEYLLEGLMLSYNTLATWCKNWLIWKDPDSGKDWRQEEKWMTEDEIVGWHHQFDGHKFEQSPGVGNGQGILECCHPSMGWQRVGYGWTTELSWDGWTVKSKHNLKFWQLENFPPSQSRKKRQT